MSIFAAFFVCSLLIPGNYYEKRIKSILNFHDLILYILGLQCEHVSDEQQYSTVSIDFEKFQHAVSSRSQLTYGISSSQTLYKECGGLENEEYRMCGKKCVLNCRHDSMAVKFLISKEECDSNKCVEGCFCKDGFVRYHNKCVPINECPARRNNKAMDFATEANHFEDNDEKQMNIQNSTQIASQLQAAINLNQGQMEKNSSNPKIFGFFNRPGCGFFGCAGIPLSIQLQQYDESVERKENDHSGTKLVLFVLFFHSTDTSIYLCDFF